MDKYSPTSTEGAANILLLEERTISGNGYLHILGNIITSNKTTVISRGTRPIVSYNENDQFDYEIIQQKDKRVHLRIVVKKESIE